MDLIAAQTLSRSVMDEYLPRQWSFSFSNALTYFGITYYPQKKIMLSAPWIAANDEANALDTIRHEVAHALAGARAGHGEDWQFQARALGASDAASIDVRTSGLNIPPMPWTSVCSTCGDDYGLPSLPKNVKVCAACKRKGVTTRLTWTERKTGAVLLARGLPVW